MGWDDPLQVRAPARNLEIEVGFPVYAFQVLSGGAPLAGAGVVFREERSGSNCSLGDHGRYVLMLPLDSKKELIFYKPGYEPRKLVLEPGDPPADGWRPVELEVAPPSATLELRIAGDPRRTVEQFMVRLGVEGESPYETQRFAGFRSTRVLKRTRDGDSMVIDGIPPGRYRVEIEPVQRSADDCYVLPQVLAVDLASGGTQTLPIAVQEGGRLRITTGDIEGERMVYRILDERDEKVTSEMLVRFDDGRQTRSFGSILHAGVSLTKPLHPGRYTVEVRARRRDAPWMTYPVTVVGGQTLDLVVGEE